MASCRGIKSTRDEGKDFISKLPVDVKDKILECLPTRDAARTALLSTHRNHVWLQHGRLVFDSDFFNKYKGDESPNVVNIINNILFLHVGPVKKFTLCVQSDDKPKQSELDRWCLFLSRNGIEELDISLYNNHRHNYKLPVCIYLCQTIKKLKLYGFHFSFPVIARDIFPNVTSFVFDNVWFCDDDNRIVSSFPKLEKLAFRYCYNITNNFEISAPKLTSLSAFGYKNFDISESRWFTVHLEAIKALCMCPDLVVSTPFSGGELTFPMAINLRVIMLYGLSFACGKQFTFTMQLLEKSPNLSKLEIVRTKTNWYDDEEAASRILEDPDNYVINQNLNMLNTVKIESLQGSRLEMLFVKTILSKSPALTKFVIQELPYMDRAMALNISRELLHFPRAAPKAQLVILEGKPN